jgi:hypothetical protein
MPEKDLDPFPMTEAVSPIMDYALEVLGFDRLIFSNAVGNERSRRVKEKTGDNDGSNFSQKPSIFVNLPPSVGSADCMVSALQRSRRTLGSKRASTGHGIWSI